MTDIDVPYFGISFKSYSGGTGENAMELAKTADRVTEETGITMIVFVQFTDIADVVREVDIPVFAQHIDPVEPGAHTGHVLPEAVKSAGAVGSMINHCERRMTLNNIGKAIERAEEVGLVSLVCADSYEEVSAIAQLGPDVILAELPELIGTGKSVSKRDPKFITEAVERINEIDPDIVCTIGAGITSPEDVEKALELGGDAAAAASGPVKADNQYELLTEIAEVLNKYK